MGRGKKKDTTSKFEKGRGTTSFARKGGFGEKGHSTARGKKGEKKGRFPKRGKKNKKKKRKKDLTSDMPS